MIRKELKKITEDNNLVSKFLAQYSLENAKSEEIKEGNENMSLFVYTPNKTFVLRIMKPDKEVSNIISELKFIEYLSQHNIDAPSAIKNKNGEDVSVVEIKEGKFPAVLMPKLEGEMLAEYKKEMVDEMGTSLANLHLLSLKYESVDDVPGFDDVVTDYCTHSEIDVNAIKRNDLREYLTATQNLRIPLEGLPVGIIHGDFHINNLLFTDTKLTAILDFDDSHKTALIQDVGVVIDTLVANHKDSLVVNFLQAYESIRKLTEKEKEMLLDFTLFRTKGLAAFFTYLYGEDKLNLEEYLDIEERVKVVLKDYVI